MERGHGGWEEERRRRGGGREAGGQTYPNITTREVTHTQGGGRGNTKCRTPSKRQDGNGNTTHASLPTMPHPESHPAFHLRRSFIVCDGHQGAARREGKQKEQHRTLPGCHRGKLLPFEEEQKMRSDIPSGIEPEQAPPGVVTALYSTLELVLGWSEPDQQAG